MASFFVTTFQLSSSILIILLDSRLNYNHNHSLEQHFYESISSISKVFILIPVNGFQQNDIASIGWEPRQTTSSILWIFAPWSSTNIATWIECSMWTEHSWKQSIEQILALAKTWIVYLYEPFKAELFN